MRALAQRFLALRLSIEGIHPCLRLLVLNTLVVTHVEEAHGVSAAAELERLGLVALELLWVAQDLLAEGDAVALLLHLFLRALEVMKRFERRGLATVFTVVVGVLMSK